MDARPHNVNGGGNLTSALAAEKTVTITISSFTNLPATQAYGTYNWSADGISGKGTIYGGTSALNMQMNGSNRFIYNTTAIPGTIKSITLTKADGSNRSFQVFGRTSAYDGTSSTYGTQIGSDTNVDDKGKTFTVTENAVYNYFVVRLNASNAAYLASVVVTYEEENSSAVATSVTINHSGITNTDLYNGTAAGSLSASVTANGSAISGASVTWSSSNENVATISSNGVVTLVAAGTTTITAAYAGVEDQYAASSATYELNVTDSTPFTGGTVTFVAGTDKGTSTTQTDDQITKSVVTVSSTKAALAFDEYRLYSGSTTTISTTTGTIKSIIFTVNSNYDLSKLSTTKGTYNNGTWTGSEESIAFSASAQVRLDEIEVYVEVPSGVATTVTIDASGITNTDVYTSTAAGSLTASVAANGSAISGATVNWSSSNTDVATIASDGVVTLVAAGTTTFTATYDGVENEYASSTATYDLTVTSSDPNAKGSATNPYTVAEIADGTATGTEVYVTGFITCGFNSSNKITTTESEFQNSNFAIADNIGETTTIAPIQVQGTFQTSFGIKNKPYNVGVAKVLIKGNIDKYFSKNGVKSVTEISKVAEQVSISSAGMATYYTDCALDFTGLTNMWAYTATVTSDGAITYTRVNRVPANTAVVLYNQGGASSNVVPVAENPETVGDNALIGKLADYTVPQTEDGATNYLLNNGDNGVGFYKASGTHKVAAHRAYLQVPASAGQVRSFYGFDNGGISTRVEGVTEFDQQDSLQVYDLQGRQVAQPQRGLYIVNGKKVVMK